MFPIASLGPLAGKVTPADRMMAAKIAELVTAANALNARLAKQEAEPVEPAFEEPAPVEPVPDEPAPAPAPEPEPEPAPVPDTIPDTVPVVGATVDITAGQEAAIRAMPIGSQFTLKGPTGSFTVQVNA